MNTKQKIHFLTHLRVKFESTDLCELLMIDVKGFSESEILGIPSLELVNRDNVISGEGILELDFVIHPIAFSGLQRREWDICPIFLMSDFPEGLRGIKVNAKTNTRLFLLEPN